MRHWMGRGRRTVVSLGNRLMVVLRESVGAEMSAHCRSSDSSASRSAAREVMPSFGKSW
ncbi:hypothetical protein [Streptomyces sp. NPDC005209]|uniref:hypothetical protein n=1 Tax=Streptomyces sp. NPDC005209 TaxID=3156715 RepID=UPI0033A8CEB1